MKTQRNILFLVLLSLGLAQAGSGDFHDAFKGKLGVGWTWVREQRDAWRVSERGLEVRLLPGNMWGGANNARNVLARPLPDSTAQEVIISLDLENHPTEQYEQVDLVWYYNDRNMVKLGQELVDGKLCVVMGREENDQTRTIAIVPLSAYSVRVRLLGKAGHVRGQFRLPDDADWRDVGECDLPAQGAPQASIQCYQGTETVEHWARINQFRIECRAP